MVKEVNTASDSDIIEVSRVLTNYREPVPSGFRKEVLVLPFDAKPGKRIIVSGRNGKYSLIGPPNAKGGIAVIALVHDTR